MYARDRRRFALGPLVSVVNVSARTNQPRTPLDKDTFSLQMLMTKTNWAVPRTLVHKIGWRRALGHTSMKFFRRSLSSHVSFNYSQTGEDLVLEFLKRRYIGAWRPMSFVEAGCHDPRRISSTYLLQYPAGGSGVCVEMDPRHARPFRYERRRDVFVCAALSDAVKSVKVYEFASPEVNTIDADQASKWASHPAPTGTRQLDSVTLHQLVQKNCAGRSIDLLHLDVEGYELAGLQGSSLDSFRPAIIMCEIHGMGLSNPAMNLSVTYLNTKSFTHGAYAKMNGYFVREDVRARFDH